MKQKYLFCNKSRLGTCFTWNAGEQCRKFLVWDVDFLLFHFFTWEAACKNGKGNWKICKQSIWHLVWYSYYIMLNSMVVREGKKKPWSAFIISYRYPKRWKIFFFFKFLCVIWCCWAVYCGWVVIRSLSVGINFVCSCRWKEKKSLLSRHPDQ